MEEKIERYLRSEKNVESALVREMLCRKVMKHDDIAGWFAEWLETRKYVDDMKAGGYTAEDIYKIAPWLDGIGVFNFLVTLRDDPDDAKKIISEGFVIG